MKYFGGFKDVGDVMDNFKVPQDQQIKDEDILFAAYGQEAYYEGDARVIFQKDGKLYEVAGSHCSCNGLEDQWKPAEISWAYLTNCGLEYIDRCYNQEAHKAFRKLLEEHTQRN